MRGVPALLNVRQSQAGPVEPFIVSAPSVNFCEVAMFFQIHPFVGLRGKALVEGDVRESADAQCLEAGEVLAVDRTMRNERDFRSRIGLRAARFSDQRRVVAQCAELRFHQPGQTQAVKQRNRSEHAERTIDQPPIKRNTAERAT